MPGPLVPEGSPARKSAIQEPLVIALARAHWWRSLLESGKFHSVEELAHAVKLDSSYVGRILRLTLLAQDIIIAIQEGQEPSWLSLGKLIKTLPSDWVEQQAMLGFSAV